MTEKIENNKNILEIKKSDQYATVEELFAKSQAGSVYYTFLCLSSLIVTSGLLLNSATIIIGGILITPLLSPILIIALGISTGEYKAIKNSSILVLKSLLVVIFLSLFLALVLGIKAPNLFFGNSFYEATLYFIVALLSGVAATFAWIRKSVSDILPGVAMAVSLIPPLSALGINLSMLNFVDSRLAFSTFIFNFTGVLIGSLVVFSLLKFYKTKGMVKKEVVAQEKEIKKEERNKK